MIPRAPIVTACFVAAGLFAATPVNAQVDYWTGPYNGPTFGQDFGTAHYYFLDDGYFNDNPGDTYDQALYGLPMGFVIGHNWRNDNLLYGIEATFYSHTTKAENSCLRLSDYTPMGQWGDCGNVNPFDPGQQLDFKGHWFVGFSARVGYVHNRLLFYAQGGPVLGHLVSRANDFDQTTGQYLWVPGSRIGLHGEVGVEVAVGKRWSFGLGFRSTYLYPLRVEGTTLDQFDNPQPGDTTNHRIFYSAHAVIARVILHTGRAERIVVDPLVPGAMTQFNWTGLHVGLYVGALWQFGVEVGYDRLIRDNLLVGGSIQVSQDRCCGPAYYEVDLNARVGHVFRDALLAYAELTLGYATGSFFGQLGGFYYGIGPGIEIALTPRISTFMEAKIIGGNGHGFFEGNFQGGFNVHLGRR
jgi:hypothetical protein